MPLFFFFSFFLPHSDLLFFFLILSTIEILKFRSHFSVSFHVLFHFFLKIFFHNLVHPLRMRFFCFSIYFHVLFHYIRMSFIITFFNRIIDVGYHGINVGVTPILHVDLFNFPKIYFIYFNFLSKTDILKIKVFLLYIFLFAFIFIL